MESKYRRKMSTLIGKRVSMSDLADAHVPYFHLKRLVVDGEAIRYAGVEVVPLDSLEDPPVGRKLRKDKRQVRAALNRLDEREIWQVYCELMGISREEAVDAILDEFTTGAISDALDPFDLF